MYRHTRALLASPCRLLAVVVLVAGAAGAAADCALRVRVTHDPPFADLAADGGARGVDPELAGATIARLGCRAEFRSMPWPRALFELQQGRLDVLGNVIPTPEREAFARFSRPVRWSGNVLYVGAHLTDRLRIHALGDIRGTGFRLGVQEGAVYSAEYVQLLQDPAFRERLVFVTHLPNAWRMIAAGRLDGQLAGRDTGATQIRELGLEHEIIASKVAAGRDPVTFALSRASVDEARARAFDAALQAVIEDGTYARIVATYLGCNVSTQTLECP